MGKRLMGLIGFLLAFGWLALGAESSWTGVISDDHCGAKHSQASDQAASCVAKCVAGGAKYALVAGGKVYQLSPQDKVKDFAGKSVKVTGTEDKGTITIAAVEPSD